MKNIPKKRVSFLIISSVLLIFVGFFCSTNVVDGGSEAGNAKVVGTIISETEKPVDSAEVTLLNKEDSIYYTIIDTTVYTNDSGKFEFNLPPIGLYYIIAKKNNKLIAYIDSIIIQDNQKKELPLYKTGESGAIKGIVEFEDTTGMLNEQITVICKELKDYEVDIYHGEEFFFADIPTGYYSIVCFYKSDKSLMKWLKVKVDPNDTNDLGKIVLSEYYTENELIDLTKKMAKEAKKDFDDVVRILNDENFFETKWKYEQKEEVIKIIAEAVEKAGEGNNEEYFSDDELNVLVKKLSDAAKVEPEKVMDVLKEGKKFYETKWKKEQEKMVVALIEAAIKEIS